MSKTHYLPEHPAILGAIGTGLFFFGWEVLNRSGWVNPVMLPGPMTIIQTAWEMVGNGELQDHLKASLWRALAGFFIGAILAILLGIAMARLPRLHGLLNPLVQMFRAVPALAFVPLAIFWFGIGEVSKIFLISWGVFFPVWVNTYLGVRDTNPLLGRAAASLGANGWRMLLYVVLPGALPFILAGLRVSLSIAMVLLVASELAGAMFGVGYLIQMSQQVFRVDQMFVGLITLGCMGFFADYLFNHIVARLLPWYGAESGKRPRRQGPDADNPARVQQRGWQVLGRLQLKNR